MSAITFTSIEAPGALQTYDFKPNNDGHVAGYFTDATGNHGFLLAGGLSYPSTVRAIHRHTNQSRACFSDEA
jgi:hypothetical protein